MTEIVCCSRGPTAAPIRRRSEAGAGKTKRSRRKDCPDDAMFAAYCERSLSPSESARCEEHFSNCARCQGMLAAIARAQTAAHAALSRTRWRRWQPYAALAASVAGISIAVNLMVTGRHQQRTGCVFRAQRNGRIGTIRQQAPSANRNDRSADRTERSRTASNPGDRRRSQQQAAIGAPKLIHPMAGVGRLFFAAWTGREGHLFSSAESGTEPAPRPAQEQKRRRMLRRSHPHSAIGNERARIRSFRPRATLLFRRSHPRRRTAESWRRQLPA